MRIALVVLWLSVVGCQSSVAVPMTREEVVRSYLSATTRESALAHLADDYRIRFGDDPGPGMTKSQAAEMLLWDFALHPVHDIEHFETRDGKVIVRHQEGNDFAMLINFPGWNATSTYTVNDAGLISEQHYVPTPDRPTWKPYLERALPWLREHRAEVLARIYPNGRLKQDADSAKEWVGVLCEWRKATDQMLPDLCPR